MVASGTDAESVMFCRQQGELIGETKLRGTQSDT